MGSLVGLIRAEALRVLAGQPERALYTIAADIREQSASISANATLRDASRLMLQRGLPELMVIDAPVASSATSTRAPLPAPM